jgi:PAS domain S-box-containing protein
MKIQRAHTILLVEDEPITAMVQSRVLERHGYAVITVATGAEAVDAALNSDDIDIILMDIDLGPGMDGTRAAELILEKRNVPVLFLSSHTEPDIVDKTETITSFGYVVKNTGETVLLASIRMAFRLNEAYRLNEIKTDEIESVNMQLQSANEELNATNEELAATNEQLNATNEELEATNEELQATMEQLMGTNAELEKVLARHRDALELLREKEYFLSKSQEIGKIGSFILEMPEPDQATHWWRSSPVMDEIVGIDDSYPRTAEKWLERIVDPESVMKYLAEHVFIKKEKFNLVYQIRRHNDGETRWIHGLGEALFDDKGRPIRMIGTGQDVTEQHLAEENLEQSESALRLLFEESPVGLSLHKSRNFDKVNKRLCEITGYSERELLGQSTRMVYFNDDEFAQICDEMSRATLNEQTASIEARLRRKDGAAVDVLIIANVIDPGDLSRGSIVSWLDITEHKRATDSLRQSEERYRAIFENTATANIITATDTTILLANENFCQLTGYSRHEVQNRMSWTAFVDADDLERMQKYHVQRRDGQASPPRTYEFRGKIRSGALRNFYMSVAMIPGTTDSIASLIDITSLRQAEEALRRSEERFRDLALLLPETIFETDSSGTITFFNQASLQRFGYTVQDIDRGMSVLDLLAPDEYPRGYDNFIKLSQGQNVGLNEYTVRRKDGTAFPSLVHTTPIMDTENRFHGVRGFLADITRIKETELNLEKTVREKNDLLRELPHRIKNNLAMIGSIIEMEKIHAQSPETTAMLESLKDRVTSMGALYGHLFSSENVAQVNLKDYLPIISASLFASYNPGKGGIRIDENYDPITVSTKDATAWGLILNELLTNAVKYAFPDNRPDAAITVSLIQNPDHTLFYLADNGPGPPGDFDVKKSAGFGLLMVDTLAGQLGGAFNFERGKKNRYTVRIPHPRGQRK